MDKHVLVAGVGLNEAAAFCPLNHFTVPLGTSVSLCSASCLGDSFLPA